LSNEKAQQDTISQTEQPKLNQVERPSEENRSIMGGGQTERRPSPPRMPLFRR